MSRDPSVPEAWIRSRIVPAGLILVVIAAYLAGWRFPREPTWGFHGLAYLAPGERGVLLGGALLLAALTLAFPGLGRRVEAGLTGGGAARAWILALLGATLSYGIFRSVPICHLVFGDGRTITTWLSGNETFDPGWWLRVVEPGLVTHKQALTVAVHRTASHLLQLDIVPTFRLLSPVWGTLFVAAWIAFVRGAARGRPGTLALALAGIVSGAVQIYFGHVEIYPFAFLVWALFFMSVYLFFDGRVPLAVVLALFLIAFRSHASIVILTPALLIPIAWSLRDRFASIRRLLAWPPLVPVLAGAALLAGLALYVVYFGSATWTEWPPGKPGDTFLPLAPMDPPQRIYSLFGWPHLADLFSVGVLLALPVFVLVFAFGLHQPRRVAWMQPRVQFFLLCVLLMTFFYLPLNPLLSIPRDWDLMTVGTLPLLFLAAALLRHREQSPANLRWLPVVAVCGVLSVSNVLVNATPSYSLRHLEDVGVHVYRYYYGNSGLLIQMGQYLEPDVERRRERRERILRDLEPWEREVDTEVAFLTYMAAGWSYDAGDLTEAARFWERSAALDPANDSARIDLVTLYSLTGRESLAIPHIRRLLQMYPRAPNILVLAAEVAIALGRSELTDALLQQLAEVDPDHPDLDRLRDRAARAGESDPDSLTAPRQR